MATKEQELLRRMISHNLTAYSRECEGTESPSHRARCEADSSHQQRVASEAAKARASTSGAASSKESPLGSGAGFVTPEDRVKKRVREDSEIPTEHLGATAISKLLDDSQIFEESDPEPDQQVMKKPAANTRKRPAASGVPSECATEAAVPAEPQPPLRRLRARQDTEEWKDKVAALFEVSHDDVSGFVMPRGVAFKL